MAHPAYVLPLRRYCSRWLDFPALVIGSLAPDLGYCFGHLHLETFSHRPLAGVLGFCLPLGLMLWLVFRLLRGPVVGLLPQRHQNALQPLCHRRLTAPSGVVASLLIGAWTHIGVDFLAHGGLALAKSLPLIRDSAFAAGGHRPLDDALCATFTFLGVAYVAMTFLNWLEKVVRNAGWVFLGFKWIVTLVAASLALLLSVASHDGFYKIKIGTLMLLSGLLLVAFLVVADGGLIEFPGKQNAKHVPDDAEIERT
jgi:hypothetical protein